ACLLQMKANVYTGRKRFYQSVESNGRTDIFDHVALRPYPTFPREHQQLEHDGCNALAQPGLPAVVVVPASSNPLQATAKTLWVGISIERGNAEKRFAHGVEVAARVGQGHRNQVPP